VAQAALRFDRLVSIAESASAAAAEAPQPDGANWFRPWAERLKAVHRESIQLIGQPMAASSVAQLPAFSDEQLSKISNRFEKWLEESTDLFGNVENSFTSLASELSIGKDHSPDQQTTHYVSEGGADELLVQVMQPASTSLRPRFVATVAIVVLLAGFWWSKTSAFNDFLCRVPYVTGVLLGIGYWAWLWPSWLGLIVAAASACLALRFNWPGRYLRPEASTVLRSTRTS
jgi:hypothetical protein